MNSKMLTRSLSVAFLILVGFLGFLHMQGCGGGGGGGGTPTATLQVAITDSPAFRDFSSVHIKITKVLVVPPGREGAADNDPGQLVIASFPDGMDVNILKLHFLQQILGSAVVPTGNYNQVRLVLAPNSPNPPFTNYFILAGSAEQVALTTPSAQESGLKINGPFTVAPGVLNTILLDFNPNEAIVKRGRSGQNNLKPTGIRIIQVFTSLTNSGSISGTIRSPAFKPLSTSTFKKWSSATVSVVPRNPAAPAVTSGLVFSNFSGLGLWKADFTAYVPPNSSAVMPSANYRVFVDAGTRFQLYSSPLMAVTVAGQDFPVAPNGLVILKSAP